MSYQEPKQREGVMTISRVIVFYGTIFLSSGCCHSEKLIAAAEAFHQSVGAQYLEYVKNDEKLSDEDKQRKRLNVRLHGKALLKYKTGK
jgi:hypothetical protein